MREQTKTDEIRRLPLVEPVLNDLKTIRGISGLVFRTLRGNAYQTHINDKWERACIKAGIPGVTMYQGTRHSRASQLVSDGVSIEIVSHILGHKNAKTTRIYAEVSTDGMEKVLK